MTAFVIFLELLTVVELMLIHWLVNERRKLKQSLKTTELTLVATLRSLHETNDRLKEMEDHAAVMTAAEIVKEVPSRRLKLRKSLSELVRDESELHNERERKHLQVVRNMETIGVRDAAMRQKE